MAAARDNLLVRLRAIERVIPERWLQNRALTPSNHSHNESARIIRNGLMVVAVAALEDFIKQRVRELLLDLPQGGLPFTDLPDGMQDAATWGVLQSASGHLYRIWRSLQEDLVAEFRQIATDVASTASSSYTLSEYSFGYSSANLTAEVVGNLAKAFGLKDAWRQIHNFALRCGLSTLDHKEAFRQSLRKRHSAAHEPSARTETTDLEAFVRDAKGIAIGFDAIMSRASRLIRDSDASLRASDGRVEGSIVVRFVDQGTDGYWREHSEGARTYRKSIDPGILTKQALTRVQTYRGVLVVRNSSKIPEDWQVTDLV